MTPNTRFNELITDITPSATTNSRSISAHTSIRNSLESDSKYKDNVIRTFLGGSYKRKTAIRPVSKNGKTDRPDVDIYVVVKGSDWSESPEDLINTLFSALNRNCTELKITKIKRNRCSIAISTDKAEMDVSPLLERNSDGYYRIGNRNTGEWYLTDPEEHTTWSAKANSDAGMRFNPMVKMVKWSRREYPTKNKHPKSIALEALVAKHMSSTETHYGQLLHDTFDDIINSYSFLRLIGMCPELDDPAIDGGNLLSGVSGEAFSAFYDKIKYFRDEAAKALATDDQDVATKHWRQILGSRFPSPKTEKSSNAVGLQSAVTMSSLTFPAKASTPPNKPADFA
ncbi:SMODS domain-containing nucleotidyltransferase [Leucothrix mucor]|uniref:SMODS domain-containing nucleotidyltransferase n=1 Tax=Leucothrix mucor TaxID=45248 RepID=UPI0003B6D992|nr:nucleotidyltransferase [Leucothrix mucor]